MLKVIHNYNCSKSRGILEILDENDVPFEIIDILADPLSVMEINTLLKKLGKSVHEIIRTNESLYKEKFSNYEFSDEEWIKILSENPSLIQRPIVIKGNIALICRPIEKVHLFFEK